MKSRVVSATFVLALIIGATAPAASADRGGSVEATFTRWVVSSVPGGPAVPMIGVVGGNVGSGTFSGEVLSDVDDGSTETIHAIYRINGSTSSFVADNTVTVNDATGVADIAGVVVGGSMNGAPVDGGFRTMSTCDTPTPGNVLGNTCYKGTLHVAL